ncbi:MAG: bifunctional isocitrate dehydrogenase kinase/phosphatase [Acidihalobacter sp.]
MRDQAEIIANTILKGFNRHFRLFQKITSGAKSRFETADWKGVQKASADRISYYERRVSEVVDHFRGASGIVELDESLWQEVKRRYVDLLMFHPQAELAETFYNSVFCKLFDRRYFNNDNIFVETTLAETIPVPKESVYRSYFPGVDGLRNTIRKIFSEFGFGLPFIDMDRDILLIVKAFSRQSDQANHKLHHVRFDILKSAFYRNKAAYIVGRVVTRSGVQPFIIPILNSEGVGLYMDTLITDANQMTVIFGTSRAYFMVETQAPSALVYFLKELLPHRKVAELYSTIGFHKQGKTEFYRELLTHMANSTDMFQRAPGVKGMVMEVFTLPSFPYVFKVIKDRFPPGKDFSRATVERRYQLVKKHDRVGRMADTMEYSDVALPVARIDPVLLGELKESIASSLEFDGELLVIKHLYIERRLTPLNIHIKDLDENVLRDAIFDYGVALKDMMAANIFPGDMLLKNFGVTRQGRVVFYDYDEVQYLLDVNFRKIPEPQTPEQEMSSEPWYSVGPNDIFPEEFATFIMPQPAMRQMFVRMHGELLDADYWREVQEGIRAGRIADIFPYPQSQRFIHEYALHGKDQEAERESTTTPSSSAYS